MDYSKYYEARDIVKTIISKDLLGPLSEDEIINDYPVSYYVVGKLYPQNCGITVDRSSSEDIGNTEEEQTVALDEGRVPASMGISFALRKGSTDFQFQPKLHCTRIWKSWIKSPRNHYGKETLQRWIFKQF